MRLFLSSSGITNPTLEKALLDLLRKPVNTCGLTFIPTAANAEKGDKAWLIEDVDNLKKLGFVSFDTVDIARVSKKRWEESFQKADLLVFGGGNVKYLMEQLHKSGVARALPKLLEKRIYMGISAGSMVTAKIISLTSANILYYEQTGNLKTIRGLGMVDFEIRPHLNSKSFPKVRQDYLEKLAQNNPISFYALDDASAVLVENSQVTVVSEGKWKRFN